MLTSSIRSRNCCKNCAPRSLFAEPNFNDQIATLRLIDMDCQLPFRRAQHVKAINNALKLFVDIYIYVNVLNGPHRISAQESKVLVAQAIARLIDIADEI